nr:MAG: putative RNA-dependent RNA polymerase [Narnaviridae sp.]
MAKVFKLSINTFFSKCTNQQLPEDSDKALRIIPPYIEKAIKSMYRVKQLAFLQDLLQCKGLAAPIPGEMIQEAYQKHRKTLSSVGESPKEFLEDFKEVLEIFGKELEKENMDRTVCPKRSGYYGWKRSEGGLFKALKPHLRTRGFRKQETERKDPIILHMEGEPGIGKSFIIKEVSKLIGQAFGYGNSNLETFSYNRTVTSEHWDGYNNQLIASIDDFGCHVNRQADDYATLIQIGSDQEFVLPMADLKEKGRKFNSNFVFLSTNGLTNRPSYNLHTLAYGPALLRRVTNTFRLVQEKPRYYKCSRYSYEMNENRFDFQLKEEKKGNYKDIAKWIKDFLLLEFDRRFGAEIFQPVEDAPFGVPGYGYYFPTHPPDRLPKCEAHAIPEPLKVRMITKNEPHTWILKPVQMALWKTLQKYKVFSLTGGPEIDLRRLFWRGREWLVSGDYESATDNMHSDIMETAVDVLSRYLPEKYREWFRWEGGKHEIFYPKPSGLDPVIQSRGQLMGSLLSFPILCLANFTTYARSLKLSQQNLSLKEILEDSEINCYINGDDILFTCNGKKDPLYQLWKKNAHSIGLKLSVGKCYVSKEFGLINSQMILSYRGKQCKSKPWTHLKSIVDAYHFRVHNAVAIENRSLVQILQGKVKTYCRIHQHQLDFSLALQILPYTMVVSLNKASLEKDPRSLKIPKEYGGIGLRDEKYEPKLIDKEIYAFNIFRHDPTKVVLKLDDDNLVIRVPQKMETRLYCDSVSIPRVRPYNLIPDEPEVQDLEDYSFPWRDFRLFRKWYKTIPKLSKSIHQLELYDSPPLDQWKSKLLLVDRQAYRTLTHYAHTLFDWSDNIYGNER